MMTDTKPIILAVDDEADMLATYLSILGKRYTPLTTSSGEAALKIVKEESISLVLMDIKMPQMNGLEVLKRIKESEPEIEIIMVTASQDISSAVEAMRLGASDYITKPFDVKELVAKIEKSLEKKALIKENLYLKETLKETTAYCDLIGKSAVMQHLFNTLERVAPTDSTVLINGESGTGKELVARAIHAKSSRTNKPFIALNCAAIPENLLESELFGHERGAFTGAMERKLGKFELAEGGTLFLDEIGCMSGSMQAKLLRVLENKTIERLGGEKSIPIDVRILSATNIDFKKAIDEGKFRHDLYYRLNIIPIALVPLRDRKEDIPLFVQYFLNKFNQKLNRKVNPFAPDILKRLMHYDWPGNVRELQNLIERLVVLSVDGEIPVEHLPSQQLLGSIQTKGEIHEISTMVGNLRESVSNYEKELLLNALKTNNHNHTKAAKALGIPRSSLNSRLESLGLS